MNNGMECLEKVLTGCSQSTTRAAETLNHLVKMLGQWSGVCAPHQSDCSPYIALECVSKLEQVMNSGVVYGNSYRVCRLVIEISVARVGQCSGVCASHQSDCSPYIDLECVSKLEQVMNSGVVYGNSYRVWRLVIEISVARVGQWSGVCASHQSDCSPYIDLECVSKLEQVMNSGVVYGNSFRVCRLVIEISVARVGQWSGVCAPHQSDCSPYIALECVSKLEQVMNSGVVYGNSYRVCRLVIEISVARVGQWSEVCAPHQSDCSPYIALECVSKLEQVMNSGVVYGNSHRVWRLVIELPVVTVHSSEASSEALSKRF